MKKLFSSSSFWPCIALLFALAMVNVPFVIHNGLVNTGPSWQGLDVSWRMALNYASQRHWVWGSDILYTYGPLAFFSTRNGWGISRWLFLLFDAFILVNFYFVFLDFLKNNKSKLLAVAILLCIVLVVNQSFNPDLSWVLLFFIIYWMLKTFYQPQSHFIVLLMMLVVISFYIKMNTDLIAILLLGVHFINLLAHKKIGVIPLLLYAVSFTLLITISALLLHVSILGYISGSLELVKGYNDTMYLYESHPLLEYSLYVLFMFMLVWFFYQLWIYTRQKQFGLLVYVFASILYVFLLLKQSVLRNDIQHLYEFYSFAPLILLCGYLPVKTVKPHAGYALMIILFALFFVARNRSIGPSIVSRITGPVTYARQFNQYNYINYLNQQNKRFIPARVLNLIGNKTVDILPWDAEYLLENKLNYKPRPVFQSQMVYTAALEQINYDYYLKHPPEFLLYDYDSIDNRYPFNDESLVNLFILNNYTLVDTFTSNERPRLLLRLKSKIIPLIFSQSAKKEISIRDTIVTDKFNFIKINLQYSFRGKIMAIFRKPPQLRINYMRADGRWFIYKTSVALLKSGLFLGDLVKDDNDYSALLTGKHTGAVKKIKLEFDWSDFNEMGVAETANVNYISQPFY